MKYPLYDLDDTEFELLVISICEEILGTGTIGFTSGTDGGRDAIFSGISNKFPSNNSPWVGRFIIQAKHTSKPTASCSDSEFRSILNRELVKIKTLHASNKLDNYLIFTNRKLTGVQQPKIEDLISAKLDNINNQVIADDTIQKWLRDYPLIAKNHNLNRLLLPLQFYDEDLKNVIVAFSKIHFDSEILQEIKRRNDKISIEEKNTLNVMSKSYFNNVFKKSYTQFTEIEIFIKSPKNNAFSKMYANTIDDLQVKIIIKRVDFMTFEEIIDYLFEYMLNNNIAILKDHRPLIRVFLHYMYYHCDIGVSE